MQTFTVNVPVVPLVITPFAAAINQPINGVTAITINGVGLPNTPAGVTVAFVGIGNGTVTACNTTSCTVTPPAAAITQEVDINVTYNAQTQPVTTLTATKPFIYKQVVTSVTRTIAAPLKLIIIGVGFDPTPANNTVSINGGVPVAATTASVTQITVDFAALATGDNIVMKVNGISDNQGLTVPAPS